MHTLNTLVLKIKNILVTNFNACAHAAVIKIYKIVKVTKLY